MTSTALIGLDTETRLFGPGNMAPLPICATYSRRGRPREIVTDSFVPIWLGKLIDLAGLGVCRLTFHNAAYDLSCYCQHDRDRFERTFRALEASGIFCTEVRERLLDIAKGSGRRDYSLAGLMRSRFEVEVDKKLQTSFEDLDGVALSDWPETAIEYAMTDAESARRLFESQDEDARALSYDAFESESSRQTAFAFALKLMSDRGVKLDAQRVEKERSRVSAELSQLENELRRFGIFHEGTTSRNMSRIEQLVEETFPGDPPRTEKRGKVVTNAEVVAECDSPALKVYSKYQLLSKLSGTYLDKMASYGSGPVHARYISLVNSGRTSSENPNLQNLPREGGARECIIPREGFTFVFCDYDSQELRTLAQACKTLVGRSTLADRYAEDPDLDPHTLFASNMLRISYEEGLKRKAARDPEFVLFRQRAKEGNFGFPVGMSAETLVRRCKRSGVDLSVSDAEILKTEWSRTWPEMNDYFRIVKDLSRHGTIRQLVSGRLRGSCSFTAAANSYFQGLAADASKNALYEVTKACRLGGTALEGCFPVVFAHDEIGLEAPIDSAPEAALELALTMEDAMNEVCPDVPARCSPLLCNRWSKKAKTLFDKDGRLKIWTEET